MSSSSMTPCCALSATGRGQLGLDLHALGHRDGAGGLRLRHRPQRAVGAGRGDVDEALAAGADRLEQRVVAEPRDLDADLLGGPDHQGVLGHRHLDAVDGQRDGSGGRGRRALPPVLTALPPALGLVVGSWSSCGHRSSFANSVEASRSNGQPPLRQVREVLLAEVLDAAGDRRGRAVAERAERAAEDVVADVEQLLEVLLGRPARARAGRGSGPATRCPHGTGCTCRRTRACRSRSSGRPRGPRRWSRRRSAGRGCRASSPPRRPTRSRAGRRGARR